MNSELEDRRVRLLLWESLALTLEEEMTKRPHFVLEALGNLAAGKRQRMPKMPSLKRAAKVILEELKGKVG